MKTGSHKLRASRADRGLVEIKARENGNLLTLGVAAVQAFPVPGTQPEAPGQF